MSDTPARRQSLASAAQAMAGLCIASLAVFLAVSQPLRVFLREIASFFAEVSGQ